MSGLSRRSFLGRTAFLAGGVAATGSLEAFAARVAFGQDKPRQRAGQGPGDYGPLATSLECPDLALPEGFHCRKFGATGSIMSDGVATPGAHDGMAAFALANGNVRLIRNHELAGTPGVTVPFGNPGTAYDANGQGGTTSLEVSPTGNRDLIRHFMSLNGTTTNCAGGPTPWGSWITCEETTRGTLDGWQKDHGYVFEVPRIAEDEVPAVPLKAMGRFVHEAIAVDPATSVIYETEDRNPGGFYRFIPTFPNNPAAGGRLQMLAIRGQANYDTRTGQQMGRPLQVEWVDIADPDPAGTSNSNSQTVAAQGFALGAARFARPEGAWSGKASIFFTTTSGGNAGRGQVWEYTPRGNADGQLSLLYESASAAALDNPDNICVSPRGGIILCEDGGADAVELLRGVTPQGHIFDFARNVLNNSEFAGATFSPDGQTLFVNIQSPGATYAIWGSWENGAL
jgi:uncharacterized protein